MHIAVAGLVLLCFSVVLNVLLAHKVRSLTRVESTRKEQRLLSADTKVPSILAKRLDGSLETISYQDTHQPTILYIFTPPCSWCARNLDNFKTLLDKTKDQYRVIGLSLSQEGLAEYVARNQLNLPVYSGLSDETKAVYRLSGTPETIVISPQGRVLQIWMGAYTGRQKSQVEAFFHVTLPGLRELPKAEAAKN